MASKPTLPTVLERKLSASKLLSARKNCKTCHGRGFNHVQYGVSNLGKRAPIIYGLPYFEEKEYCSCVKGR